MSTNRPFLANFLAAFRAQSTFKSATQQPATSSTLSSAQISTSARTIASKPGHQHQHQHSSSASSSSSHQHHQPAAHNTPSSTSATTTIPTSTSQTSTSPQYHSHHYHHTEPPSQPSTPIPISRGPDRQRRGSDSSSGSGGFRDALGPEKWYIGGRTPAGEERFYRLGMVTKGGGGRVGSIDQLSL